MLILARKVNESIMIGDQIEISIVDIRGEQVKIGIRAPAAVKVYRQEVYRAIQQENVAAASASPARLPALQEFLKPDKTDDKPQQPGGAGT
jgi:carbon storage regulator